MKFISDTVLGDVASWPSFLDIRDVYKGNFVDGSIYAKFMWGFPVRLGRGFLNLSLESALGYRAAYFLNGKVEHYLGSSKIDESPVYLYQFSVRPTPESDETSTIWYLDEASIAGFGDKASEHPFTWSAFLSVDISVFL